MVPGLQSCSVAPIRLPSKNRSTPKRGPILEKNETRKTRSRKPKPEVGGRERAGGGGSCRKMEKGGGGGIYNSSVGCHYILGFRVWEDSGPPSAILFQFTCFRRSRVRKATDAACSGSAKHWIFLLRLTASFSGLKQLSPL